MSSVISVLGSQLSDQTPIRSVTQAVKSDVVMKYEIIQVFDTQWYCLQ